MVVQAGDDDLLAQTGELPQIFRQSDAALIIKFHVHGAGQEMAREGAHLALTDRQSGEAGGDLLKLFLRI